jgi:DNA end-binding protein Ku
MARAIWSGSISFGLLNVPVKLYSAVSKQTVRFRELREDDGARIRHKRVAESDGKEVPYEKIVKGYEYAPDQYVVLSRDELAELEPQRSRAIEIQDFVDLDDIDPIFFEQPYYLGPDKGAERAYALLVQALKESHKVAIARFVLRNKEHLAAVRPMEDVLTLTTMRFHDEVSSPKDLDGEVFEEAKPKKPEQRELEMAKQLIESLTSDFKPDQYRDEYREELLDLIERKAKGEDVVVQHSEEPTPTKAPDLMAALEESLAAVRGEELGEGEEKTDGRKRSTRSKGTASKRTTKSPAKSKSSKSGSTKSKSRSRAKAGSKK